MKRFAVLSVAGVAAAVCAGFALAAGAGLPTSVSISVSPGGATCTYSETATPKVTCAKLVNQRIKSGTKVTLVAKANAALPAGWKLFIVHQYVGPDRNDFVKKGGAKSLTTYPSPLCSSSSAPTCSRRVTRTVLATTFDLYRAVVLKDDGTSFEAQMYIRWCDKSTPGCVG